MENLVKLTYLFLLDYGIRAGEPLNKSELSGIVRAVMKSDSYVINIIDVINFIKKYDWKIIEYGTKAK